MKSEKKPIPRKHREYPPIYEKIVPVFLIVLALLVIGLLIAAFGVVLGFVA